MAYARALAAVRALIAVHKRWDNLFALPGVAALMLRIWPGLTSAQIQGIMRSTSAPLSGQTFGWRNDTGFGLIDAAACVKATAEFADMMGSAQ